MEAGKEDGGNAEAVRGCGRGATQLARTGAPALVADREIQSVESLRILRLLICCGIGITNAGN